MPRQNIAKLAAMNSFLLQCFAASNHRTFAPTILALLSILWILPRESSIKSQPNGLPNILFILADDLGYGDLRCYNDQSKVPTPNIDQLAREGLRFTDAHSPSTVCTPTRYSILTGRMAFRTGMKGVFTGAGGPCLIEKNRLTLPAMLQKNGYATALIGKWHVGLTFFDTNGNSICENGLPPVHRIDYSRPIPDGPLHRGFDHFYGTACCPTTDWLYAYIDGDRIPVPPTKILDRSPLPKHPYSRDNRPGKIAPNFNLEEVDLLFLKKIIHFLERHAQKSPRQPFFLFHSAQAVHLPSFPADAFKGKTNAGPHGDFIFQLDHIIGQLLKTLQRLNLAQNTLVLFASDNGPEVSTTLQMRQDHQHDGARPWRGLKRDNWEGGHRIPLIARWPNRIPANAITRQTVCLTDLMATFAELANFSLPNNAAEDSVSFLPLFRNPNQPVRQYTLHQTNRLQLAIRRGPWKYLHHQSSGGNDYRQPKLQPLNLPNAAPDAPGQLYNLQSDPQETQNLYNQHPEIVAELQTKLQEYRQSGRSAPQKPGAEQ